MTDDQQTFQFGSSADETPAHEPSAEAEEIEMGRYVVFVDESGDHGVASVDPQYPIFVLAFCCFHKRHYTEAVVPEVHKFKFERFGHDCVVLHEHEIRKEKGAFKFRNKAEKNDFMGGLAKVVEASNFIIMSSVVRKDQLRKNTRNVYHLALEHCLEALRDFLAEKGELEKRTHVVFEKRGRKEDNQLELEFRRICDDKNLPFEVVLADKKSNSAGLQLADLVARPIGLSVLRPEQKNRTYDILMKKFFCSGGRQNLGVGVEGFGLRIIPQKNERPR